MKSAIRFVIPLFVALLGLDALAQGIIKGTVKTTAGRSPGVIVIVKGGSFEKIVE